MENYGLLSLIPPIIAIVFAISTKQVIISFFVAVWAGTTILAGGNPVLGLIDIFRNMVLPAISDPSNAAVLFTTLLIGAFANLLEKGGGALAFSNSFKKSKINSQRGGQLVTALGGIVCFFSDATNAIILGPIFRPITDQLKISREKLAYIVDSTSSPVALLVPFSTWAAFLIGLIQDQFTNLGISEPGFLALTNSIPFNFYAIGAVVMVFIVAITGKDFGAMKIAEDRAREKGILGHRDGVALNESSEESLSVSEESNPTIWNALLPLIVLIISIITMFLWTGGFPENSMIEAFSNADPMASLSFSFFLAGLTTAILSIASKVLSPQKALKLYFEGSKGMIDVIFILAFAWSIGRVSKELGTASYIVEVTKGFLSPALMYIIVFLGAAVTSFTTGSSWGTFAIFIPIAIPLAHELGAPIYPAIGAAFSGGLFGDHCSPISDTTILSSMGAQCDHIAHVNTQLPYALLVAAASSIGYLFTGLFNNALIGLTTTFISLAAIWFVLYKKTKVEV